MTKQFSSQQHQNDISFEFVPAQMGQIVTIIDNSQPSFWNTYDLKGSKGWLNAQLVELYAYSDIRNSIPESQPPRLIQGEDETNVQLTNNYLWSTSRIELELYKQSGNGKWVVFGIVPLKHNSGFRYRRYRLIDLFTDNVQSELGRNSKLGVRLVNVGYGNLIASDKITIIGSWIQEPVLILDQLPYVINTANFSGTSGSSTPPPTANEITNEFTTGSIVSSTRILNSREKRTSLTITVQSAGASGGIVGAWVSNGWSSTISPNPIAWTSSQAGLIINELTNWKGEVWANQNGFGSATDAISLRVVEKYTL